MEQVIRQFHISGRPLDKDRLLESIDTWRVFINAYYGPGQIKSIYTSLIDRSPLYGGRNNTISQSISYEQVELLNANDIGLMLTLSNHFFSEEAYAQTIPILERLENRLNSIVIVNDDLARRVRLDFPLFTLKASVIKGITRLDRIHQALELYDHVTLPPKMNDDEEFLRKIDCKDKIVIFANAGCLYKCPGPTCYRGLSELIFYKKSSGKSNFCSYQASEHRGTYSVFPVHEDKFQGYSMFKLIPLPLDLFLPRSGATSLGFEQQPVFKNQGGAPDAGKNRSNNVVNPQAVPPLRQRNICLS